MCLCQTAIPLFTLKLESHEEIGLGQTDASAVGQSELSSIAVDVTCVKRAEKQQSQDMIRSLK